MPLRREGMSYWQSFFWGQVSGMVEPIGGLLGAYAVGAAQPILPYALSFAAGAMIYVVVDQLVSCSRGEGRAPPFHPTTRPTADPPTDQPTNPHPDSNPDLYTDFSP